MHDAIVSSPRDRRTPGLGVTELFTPCFSDTRFPILVIPIVPVVTAKTSKCPRDPVRESIPFDDISVIASCVLYRRARADLRPALAEVAVAPGVGCVHLSVLVDHGRAPRGRADHRRRALRVHSTVEAEGEHAFCALYDLGMVDTNPCPLNEACGLQRG